MSAKKHYLSGDYQLAASADSTPKDIIYKIAGLIFTGQHKIARILFSEYSEDLNLEDLVFGQFHLGISYVRTSEYKRAQEYFIKNILILRNEKIDRISEFFCFQGISFYRFFFSEHRKSYDWANKAYSSLLKSKKNPPLFLALSLDLQGHNLIQLGQIHLGIKKLNEALAICEVNQFLTLKNDFRISIAIYTSQFSSTPAIEIQNLKKLLDIKDNFSDYSKSELVLQIAKMYILMGEYNLSKQFLTQNYDLIYNNENKRKIATLNTVMAELLYKRGQFLEALSVAKVARKNLDENIDISLILPILNLEIKILRLLEKDESSVLEYTKKLTQKVDRYLDRKIFSRINGIPIQTEIGQDPLGDIIDLSHRKKKMAFDQIIQNNLFGLIPSYFDLVPGQKYLLIVNELRHLFAVDFDSVSFHGSLTKNQILFLQNLHTNGISKENLIEKIWGYEYESLRHDSLIYTTVSRIKKNLQSKKQWIVSDENKYFLQDDIILVFKSYKNLNMDATPAKSDSEILKTDTADHSNKSRFLSKKIISKNLNYRLVQTLSDPPEMAISVSMYAKIWNVTRMTSLRDLNELCKHGLAVKMGQGKATRYLVQNN